MARLHDTLIPSDVYNKLPHISEVSSAPVDHSKDLDDLRMLLLKHKVPSNICVRLIHKHFDARDGEVMVLEKATLPGSNLHGVHYFVTDNQSFQAYEFGSYTPPELTGFGSFLDEFASLVAERGLQHKFGLKLNGDQEMVQGGWTELEVHHKRSTIIIPDGVPLPAMDVGHTQYSVTTEWNAISLIRATASTSQSATMAPEHASIASIASIAGIAMTIHPKWRLQSPWKVPGSLLAAARSCQELRSIISSKASRSDFRPSNEYSSRQCI